MVLSRTQPTSDIGQWNKKQEQNRISLSTPDNFVIYTELRQVDIIRTDIDTAMITGDLDPGDHIITKGLHHILPGMQVIKKTATTSEDP